MRGTPLATEDAINFLRIVKTSGAGTIVFAGGDPSLRTDLGVLVSTARLIGLCVEIQTNAHFQPQSFLDLLAGVDLVGLSLDAHESEVHDRFRGRPGNFNKVIQMLDFLAQKGVPVIVRSLVSALNHEHVPKIAILLKGYSNISRWSLLEFTPIGEGFQNQPQYTLDRESYERCVASACFLSASDIKVDVYRNEDKRGTYALVTPDGQLYGTGEIINGDYPKIGSMLQDHLSELSNRLAFAPEKHARRYGTPSRIVGDELKNDPQR